MRIISDPVSISDAMPGSTSQDDEEEEGGQSSPRWAPSAFSGPGHFRSMVGQCFSLQKGKYDHGVVELSKAVEFPAARLVFFASRTSPQKQELFMYLAPLSFCEKIVIQIVPNFVM